MQLVTQFGGDLRVHCCVVRLVHARQIVQEQHRIRRLDFFPCARDADLFDLVIALAQTGGVDHMQRHAFDLDGLLHLVARRARDGSDDGQLRACQRVEQRTLARVRLSGDHHLDALAQQRALLRTLHHRAKLRLQALQLPCRVGLFQKVDLFFGKVERRLDQHAQMDQRIAQRVDLLGECARKRTPRTARRRFGARVDQVCNRLGLRQIDLVVEERALGELARLGQAQLRQRRLCKLHAARDEQLQNHRPAVRLQLQHVFARVAVRPRKEQRQPAIDGLTCRIGERQIVRLARIQLASEKLLDKPANPLARHPHDPHGSASGSGGNGNDGVGVARKHGGRVTMNGSNEGCDHSQPMKKARLRGLCKDSLSGSPHAHLSVVQFGIGRSSARCCVVTPLRIAQGRIWWWTGM